MKLRNKKTGEIVEFGYLQTDYVAPLVFTIHKNGKPEMYAYNSLAELNKEWEDAPEEPERKHWYMTSWGEVWQYGDDPLHEEWRIILGNDFETKEEAEQAVEKLKAWKRLKDKGFRFNGWNGTRTGSNISYISEVYYDGCTDDMELLFGGEE